MAPTLLRCLLLPLWHPHLVPCWCYPYMRFSHHKAKGSHHGLPPIPYPWTLLGDWHPNSSRIWLSASSISLTLPTFDTYVCIVTANTFFFILELFLDYLVAAMNMVPNITEGSTDGSQSIGRKDVSTFICLLLFSSTSVYFIALLYNSSYLFFWWHNLHNKAWDTKRFSTTWWGSRILIGSKRKL